MHFRHLTLRSVAHQRLHTISGREYGRFCGKRTSVSAIRLNPDLPPKLEDIVNKSRMGSRTRERRKVGTHGFHARTQRPTFKRHKIDLTLCPGGLEPAK